VIKSECVPLRRSVRREQAGSEEFAGLRN